MSGYLEKRRDDYIDRMRDVSATDNWVDWILFFFLALEAQAKENIEKAENIRNLYDEMKERMRILLTSQWSTTALDFMFTRPVFRNNVFTAKSGIPPATAHRFTRTLIEEQLLHTIVPASGRRPAMYAFEPLLSLVR